jgi:hypothetical protein
MTHFTITLCSCRVLSDPFVTHTLLYYVDVYVNIRVHVLCNRNIWNETWPIPPADLQ